MSGFESKYSSFNNQIVCKPEPFEWNFFSRIDNHHQAQIDFNHATKIDKNENRMFKFNVAKSNKRKDATYNLKMDWGDDKDEKVEEFYKCYHKSNLESVPHLLEDLETSEKQPRKDESIFFLITTCFANNLLLLGKRYGYNDLRIINRVLIDFSIFPDKHVQSNQLQCIIQIVMFSFCSLHPLQPMKIDTDLKILKQCQIS